MKERVTYVLLAFLLTSLVLFSGCFSKVKEIDKISGPSWVTSLTMPLVARVMEEDENGNPISHSEIRLGNNPNGIGEEGLGLTGKSLSYRLESEDLKWEERLETVEVELGPILDIDLENPIPGSVSIPPNELGVNVDLTDTDFAGVRLSDAYEKGVWNDITIELTNGSAGPGGLRFSLVNYEGEVAGAEVSEAEILEGDATGHLNLSGKTIPPHMYIKVEGAVEATAANAGIKFTGSTLQIAAVKVSKDKLVDLYKVEETIDLGEVDLKEDRPEITLKTASLEFVHDFPGDIQVTTQLKLEGRDQFGSTIISHDYFQNLQGKGTASIEFKNELNEILNSPASVLAFEFTEFNLSPATSEPVEVELGTTFSLQVIPEIGFEKIITIPQNMEVPGEIKENPLQAFMIYLDVKNTSPAGFDLAVYLSPEPVPVDDDDAVKIEFSIEPAKGDEPGVYDNTSEPIILNTKQLNYLTKGEIFYSQIEFVNKSEEDSTIADDDYIEIRAWARVDILVNKKEEEAN